MRFLLLLLLLTGAATAQPSPTRLVAVTFDDLPAVTLDPGTVQWAAVTDRLLHGIAEARVPAVGFVNESRLYRSSTTPDPERVALLQRWLDAGLELGNHTYSHRSLNRIPLDTFTLDVLRGERVTRRLSEEAGRPFRYFRHPFLHTGRDTSTHRSFERFLDAHGYTIAPVTIDNSDWIFARAYDRALASSDSALARRVADTFVHYMEQKVLYWEEQSRALFAREIPHVLLLHANRLNADHFPRLAEMLRSRGYRFAPLETVLQDEVYRSQDTFTGAAGPSWIHRWAITQGKRGAFFGNEPETPDWVMKVAQVEGE